MHPYLKRALGLLGCTCVFFGALFVLGLGWFSTNREKMRAPSDHLAERVAAIAPSGPEACFYEALTWKNGGTPLLDEVEAQSFFQTCLRAAQTPASFCQEVPPPEQITSSQRWAKTYCEARSTQTEACHQLTKTLQQFCTTSPDR